MEPSLLDKTRLLLANRDCSLEAVALGAKVGVSWLQKFSLGRIPNAGAVRVQAVHDYLLSVNHGRKATPQGVPNRSQNMARVGNG